MKISGYFWILQKTLNCLVGYFCPSIVKLQLFFCGWNSRKTRPSKCLVSYGTLNRRWNLENSPVVGELVDLSTSEFMMFFLPQIVMLFVSLEHYFEIRDLRKLNCRCVFHYFGWCVCCMFWFGCVLLMMMFLLLLLFLDVLDEQFLLCFVFSRFMDEASHDTYVYNTPRCRLTWHHVLYIYIQYTRIVGPPPSTGPNIVLTGLWSSHCMVMLYI